jgi:hypothetical protein
MQIRGSPNGARHSPPHLSPPGRDRSERVVVIIRNGRSPSIGTGGRHHSVRPAKVSASSPEQISGDYVDQCLIARGFAPKPGIEPGRTAPAPVIDQTEISR